MNPKRGPWTILSREPTYDNRWVEIVHHEVLTPAGTRGIYGTVHFKNLAIGIVPVDGDGCTYLVGQHRFPLDTYSWEIPEGGGVHDVDPVVSAARELREETGFQAEHWQRLLGSDLSNSVTDEKAETFLAWGLTAGTAAPEPTEELALRRLPLSEAFRMVASGEIRDSLSIMSLQCVELMRLRGTLPCPFS